MLKWGKVRTLRFGKGTKPTEMILKLVLGRERCTHDSQFSVAAMAE